MAMEFDDQDTVRKRKRKRGRDNSKRKLLVGERVEVRSVEDGFQGSWHAGTVTEYVNQGRHVKYDHILCDDGSGHLVDVVDVSPIVDGIGHSNGNQCNYRGCIRPLPPPVEFGNWDLPYGLCVDVYYKEAWWEGVIFDYEDGLDKRKIFFPDLGDELTVGMDVLRITQNWDEVAENWHRSGSWLFLQVIHDLEQVCPLFVSVKQIWYDIRVKRSFEKVGEWTSNVKASWKELVLEVVGDNLKFFAKEFLEQGLRSAEPAIDLILNPVADLANSHAVVPAENPSNNEMIIDHDTNVMKFVDCSFSAVHKIDKNCGLVSGLLHTDPKCTSIQPYQEELVGLISATRNDCFNMTDSNVSCHDKALCMLPQPLLVLPCSPDGLSSISSITNGEGFSSSSSNKIDGKPTLPKSRKPVNWLPAGRDILPGAEFFPDAVAEYARASMGKKKPPNSIIMNTRMHLFYLGWKIEYSRDQGFLRLRYISPGGKCYYSLRQVFLDAREPTMEILSSITPDDQRTSRTSPDVLSSVSAEQLEENEDPDYCPRAVVSPHSDMLDVEPEYCPQAVVDYYIHGLNIKSDTKKINAMRLKARRHLAAVGWVFWHKIRRGRSDTQYSSPGGKCFHSLRQACKGCIEEGVGSDSIASTPRPMKTIDVCEEVEGQLGIEKLSAEKSLVVPSNAHSENWSTESSSISLSIKFGELGKVIGIRKLRRKRNQTQLHAIKGGTEIGLKGDKKVMLPKFQKASRPKLKRGKVSGALIKLSDDAADSHPTRVLRSSKRARQEVIPSSSHRKPRTVLSWLIDNNVVLPRAKVYYRDRKDCHPKAEGRITRDGIKCSCCQKVFTLSSFEVHAGSKYRRPAANTFLKDGRSLVDCQMEMVHDNKIRRCTREPCYGMKHHRHQGENDNICSVCHYGGELVLCDQCPSSFHKSCLGLKDVSDGEWFCPSCCCGICGQSKFRDDSESFMDGSFVNCDQCEHKYHVGCLRKTAVVNLGSYPKENWFCSKKCEKISLGLHKLLGKSIPVGVDNLTWTLLKCMNSDSQDFYGTGTEALTENYSKLNVALGVMHECFEPLKETLTNRDLVEDVIFSRGSDLNRLNFRGFYTVLLERNDEMITVATVRVYGEKVAEVPLVGTRSQYRRLGMCRTLMNELEKKLMELGVERLILPAVPSVLNTWTISFGFSKMTDTERLQFLDYTFLDFQDTVMCQKLLRKIDLTESSPSRGIQPKLHGDNIYFDGSSAISEVLQAEQIEENGIVDQRLVNIAGGNGCVGNDPVHLAVVANQLTHLESEPWLGKISPECLVEDANSKKEGGGEGNGYLKCYKRRRISAFRN